MENTPAPVKPELAERYEEALTSFGANYEEATNRLQYRGGLSATRRWKETVEERAEIFAEAISDLERRIAIWQTALEDLKRASNLRETGEPALAEYETALQNWHEQNRHREMFEQYPELYTLHAIAIKKAMNTAEIAKGVKWSKQTRYGMEFAVYATVNGLTREEVEQAVDDYIEARQMSYTVSTKNIKMKVA